MLTRIRPAKIVKHVWRVLQVSEAVVRMVEELEPVRQAIFEAQTAYGQTRWNEHLAVDLRLAGGLGCWLTACACYCLQAGGRWGARIAVYMQDACKVWLVTIARKPWDRVDALVR